MLTRLPRHPRRSSVTAVGALLLAPLVASCGFDYATDRVNTISSGTNDRSGSVDVLGAAIIAEGPRAGAFVAGLANNETAADASDTLVDLGGTEVGEVEPASEVEPVVLNRRGYASLFRTGGIPVVGDFGAGDFVEVTLTFESGQTTTLEVPVVPPCDHYDLAKFPEIEMPTAPPLPADATEEQRQREEADAYSCEQAEEPAHGEEEAH